MSSGFKVVKLHAGGSAASPDRRFLVAEMDGPRLQALRYCLPQSVSDSGLFYNHIASRLVAEPPLTGGAGAELNVSETLTGR